MTNTYTIELSPAAQRELKKIPANNQRSIIKKIESLEQNPFTENTKKLSGTANLFRIRSGDFRIIYQIRNKQLVILVLKVANRKDIYNNIKSLLKSLVKK